MKTQGRDAQAALVRKSRTIRKLMHLANVRDEYALDELRFHRPCQGLDGSQLESLILAQNERWRQA